MKSYIVATTLLGSAGIASAAEYPSMVMDTWCITYLSTYLAPISAQPGSSSSRHFTFFGNSSTAAATVLNTVDQSFIASESGTTLGVTTLDISPTQAQSNSEALSSGPTTGPLTETINTPPLSATDITSSALATSTGIVEPSGRSVIFLVHASSNQERGIKKRDIGGFVGADDPDVCTFALTFNLGDGQLFVGGLPTFYAGEDYKALGVQDEDSFVQGAITGTFGISGRTLVFRNSDLPNGEAGFCQDSGGQVYITFTASPPGCIPVTLDVYDTTQCQNGRLVGSETSTSALAISTEASMAETNTAKTGMAENVSSEMFGSGEPTTAEATVFTEVSSLSSSERSGPFSESSDSKALTTTSSQIVDTSTFASSPIFGSILSTVSSKIDETSTSASSSVSGTTVFPQAIGSSASTTFSFEAPTIVSSQIVNTSTLTTSSLSSIGALSTVSLQAITSSASTTFSFGAPITVSSQIVDISTPATSSLSSTGALSTVSLQAISLSASTTFSFRALTTVSSQIVDTSTLITSSLSDTGTLYTVSLQAISSSASTSGFGTSTIVSTQIVDTSASASSQTQTQTFGFVTSTVISSELVESFVTIQSSILSGESSTKATSSTKASSSTEQGESNLLTTTSKEPIGTSSPTFGSTSETSSEPASSDISDTSSSAKETTSYSSTTISESSTEITTTTIQASTVTTETSTTITETSTITTELIISTIISESSTVITTTTIEASTITTETSTTMTEASTTTTELMISTTISESSTEITTPATEASTTTTELMTTTTTAAPQSECQSASSPYTVQGVDFDLSCDSVITGGTSVGVAPATDFNQCVYFCAVYSACVAVHYERATGACSGFSSMTGTSANSGFDAAIRS